MTLASEKMSSNNQKIEKTSNPSVSIDLCSMYYCFFVIKFPKAGGNYRSRIITLEPNPILVYDR